MDEFLRDLAKLLRKHNADISAESDSEGYPTFVIRLHDGRGVTEQELERTYIDSDG
jgi:hypothetical protein